MSKYDEMPLTEFLNACTMMITLKKEAFKAVEQAASSKSAEQSKLAMMMQLLERFL